MDDTLYRPASLWQTEMVKGTDSIADWALGLGRFICWLQCMYQPFGDDEKDIRISVFAVIGGNQKTKKNATNNKKNIRFLCSERFKLASHGHLSKNSRIIMFDNVRHQVITIRYPLSPNTHVRIHITRWMWHLMLHTTDLFHLAFIKTGEREKKFVKTAGTKKKDIRFDTFEWGTRAKNCPNRNELIIIAILDVDVVR